MSAEYQKINAAEDNKLRRIVNLRIMFIVALSEIVAIFLLCLSGINTKLSVALILIYYLLLSALCFVFYKTAKYKLCIAFALCLLIGVITNVSFEIRLSTYNGAGIDGNEHTVSGYIDTIVTDDGYIKSLTLDNVTADGKNIGGKIQLLFSDDELSFDAFSLGYKISTSGKLHNVNLMDGFAVNGNAYRKDIRYKLYISSNNIQVSPGNPGIFGRIRRAIYERLCSACGNTYGSIAYCMLTGDKSELDSTTYKMYSMSGLGHILAVSGLHVGLIIASLSFLLKKCKLNKTVRVIVLTAVLVLYSLFVGMTASVVRSAIMCVIGLLTMINGERKDALSSLCVAFTAILMFEPFLLFEVGFLMSFTAVLGLILFKNSFEKSLLKIHIPKLLAFPFSATAAVHIVISPVSAYFFGSLHIYSIIFNLLLVPFLSVLFVLFVIITPISVVLELDILLRILGGGFAVGDIVMGIAPYLPMNNLSVYSHGALFLLYPLIFVASRFFMLPKFKKTLSVLIFVVSFSAVSVVTVVSLKVPEELRYSIIPVNGYSDVTTVIVNDEITVLGDLKDTVALKSVLKKFNIRKIDTVLLNGLDKNVGNKLADFVSDYEVGRIVCPSETTESEGIKAIGKFGRFFLFEENIVKHVEIVRLQNNRIAYVYEFNDKVSLLSVGYSGRYYNVPYEILDKTPLIRCFMYLNFAPDRAYFTNMPKNYLGEVPKYQYSTADDGDYAFKVLNGSIIKRK